MNPDPSTPPPWATHYQTRPGGLQPWDLQREMKSSGSLFVDSRRCDAMRYLFRVKADLEEDLRKAAHCLIAAADELERLRLKEEVRLRRSTLAEAVTSSPVKAMSESLEPEGAEPEVEQVRCSVCSGSGFRADGFNISSCPECSGSGWVIERKEGQPS